jgi:excisionase family DNA binding protein
LSVTKAARLLGVHPNTIRAWSDAGRLRYYRINPRGDRRYRLGDLQRFLAAAETGAADGSAAVPNGQRGGRRRIDPSAPARFGAAAAARRAIHSPAADPLDTERHRLDLTVASAVTRLINAYDDADEALEAAVRAFRDAYGHHIVAAWEARGDRLSPRAVAAADLTGVRLTDLPGRFGILGKTLELAAGLDRRGLAPMPGVLLDADRDGSTLGVFGDDRPELAVAIPGEREPWGVLLVVGETPGSLGPRDLEIARVAADGLGAIVTGAHRASEVAHLLHRAEALRRVASDIGSRLDLDRILSGLVDHAMVLFEGDRAAVFLQQPEGRAVAEVSRGLSPAYLNAVRDSPKRSLSSAAVAARKPLFAIDYANDPRGTAMRAAVIQEGYDTLCVAPLLDGTDLLGMLNVYHDQPHQWTEGELETVAALATQASVAIRA